MVKNPDRKIKTFVNKVKKKFNIEKAILFGSRARGDHFIHSDYDIIFVSKDFKGIFFTKRMAMLYKYWDYYPLDIEPICYTPAEFNRKKKQIGIVNQAVKEGIEI